MESTVKERLIAFLKYKKLSQSKFEKHINVGNGFVNNISKGIGADKLQRIIYSFPELNTGWLIDGIGEMLKENEPMVSNTSDIISMPADVWAVISSQAESLRLKDEQMNDVLASLRVKDKQTSEAIKQTAEVIEQLKKRQDVDSLPRAANLVVVEDE